MSIKTYLKPTKPAQLALDLLSYEARFLHDSSPLCACLLLLGVNVLDRYSLKINTGTC